MLQPCLCRIGQKQWEVANNETITIRSTGLASKPVILDPQSKVCFPRVFQDVGRRSVPWWEGSIEDVSAEGLRPRQVEPRALVLAAVVVSIMTRVVAVASFLSLVALSTLTGIQGVSCITVEAKTLMHWGRGMAPAAARRLVDRHVPDRSSRGCTLTGSLLSMF